MSEEMFSKKNPEKISSPESLNVSIRVSSPGVWILMTAVIVLLAGFCLWGIFGHIDGMLTANAYANAGSVTCYISETDMDLVRVGAAVKLGGAEGTLTSIGEKNIRGIACTAVMETEIPDGMYEVQIAAEHIRPISFVLN